MPGCFGEEFLFSQTGLSQACRSDPSSPPWGPSLDGLQRHWGRVTFQCLVSTGFGARANPECRIFSQQNPEYVSHTLVSSQIFNLGMSKIMTAQTLQQIMVTRRRDVVTSLWGWSTLVVQSQSMRTPNPQVLHVTAASTHYIEIC